FGKIDVKHHHNEEKQDRDRAHVNDDQHHGEEFGAQQQKQSGGIHERKNQKQHGMHGVFRRNHHEGRGDAHAGKEIKEQRGQNHSGHRYGASSAMFFAISRSQRSPFESSR